MKAWDWRTLSKAHALGTPKMLASTIQQRTKFVWACMAFLSNLHKQIFKSVTHGLRNLGKAIKNGQRLTLMWVCNHGNSTIL